MVLTNSLINEPFLKYDIFIASGGSTEGMSNLIIGAVIIVLVIFLGVALRRHKS